MRKKISGIVNDMVVEAIHATANVIRRGLKWFLRLCVFWGVYKLVFIKYLDPLKKVVESQPFLVLITVSVFLILWLETWRKT